MGLFVGWLISSVLAVLASLCYVVGIAAVQHGDHHVMLMATALGAASTAGVVLIWRFDPKEPRK